MTHHDETLHALFALPDDVKNAKKNLIFQFPEFFLIFVEFIILAVKAKIVDFIILAVDAKISSKMKDVIKTQNSQFSVVVTDLQIF